MSRLLRAQIVVVALLFVGYATYYACRSNLSVCMPLLIDELVAGGMTEDDARTGLGTLASAGVLLYAVGKFFGGPVADRFGGRGAFLGGLLGAILATVAFVASGGLLWFTGAWALNRLLQAFGWPGLVALSSRWFAWSVYGTAMGVISLSYLVGDAAARLWMGWLIALGWGWRGIFLAAVMLAVAVFLLLLAALRPSPEAAGLQSPEARPETEPAPSEADARGGGTLAAIVGLLRRPDFLLVCGLSVGFTLLRETFNTWTPTFFVEGVGLSSGVSSALSAVFPILGAVSVVLAGILGDRLGLTGRASVLSVGIGLCAVTLTGLALAPATVGAWLPVTLVAATGFLLIGPYSYLAGAVALDFGGKRASGTASGVIDGVGYLAGVLAGDGVARVVAALGWGPAFGVLAGVAVATAGIAGVYLWLQLRRAAA